MIVSASHRGIDLEAVSSGVVTVIDGSLGPDSNAEFGPHKGDGDGPHLMPDNGSQSGDHIIRVDAASPTGSGPTSVDGPLVPAAGHDSAADGVSEATCSADKLHQGTVTVNQALISVELADRVMEAVSTILHRYDRAQQCSPVYMYAFLHVCVCMLMWNHSSPFHAHTHCAQVLHHRKCGV